MPCAPPWPLLTPPAAPGCTLASLSLYQTWRLLPNVSQLAPRCPRCAVLTSSPKIRNLAMLVMSYGVSHRLFEFAWKGQLRLLYPTSTVGPASPACRVGTRQLAGVLACSNTPLLC